MKTILFEDFIPRVIEQDDTLKQELLDELASGEEEVRIRDKKEAVYILGLKKLEDDLRIEMRRIKHLLAQMDPIPGDFALNASLASVLIEKQKELHIKVYEEEIAREYNGL